MSKVSSLVRALPYPSIEAGNFSFPDGEYDVNFETSEVISVEITHRITNAPFLQRLIDGRKAKFGCLVSVPLTSYRKLHLSDSPKQTVKWELKIVGEPPMLCPVVICLEEIKHIFGQNDGVAEIWQGAEVVIPKGARLARGEYRRTSSSLSQLIKVSNTPEMKPGSFEVKPCAEDGFYFNLNVAEDLFKLIQSYQFSYLRRSILVHVASRCLEILSKEYGLKPEEDENSKSWEIYRNLVALTNELEKKGLSHWSDDDFAPEKVATSLYPLEVPNENDLEAE
ncbi:MAG: hypothetical protein OXC39_04200 [Candidatus Dadabacteria bacterium]|nr:hypothetical protein [Candidatus Dadabacteria bacterium]